MRCTLLVLLVLVLASCSSKPHRPAPVVDLQGSNASSQYARSSIKGSEYIVKKGETLYSIAWRSDSDVRTLASINRISPPYQIFPGQKIFVKPKSTKASSNNSSAKKSNKYSSQASKKNVNKGIAQPKKQEYGKTASGQKESKKVAIEVPTIASKIKGWGWPSNGKIISYFSTRQQGNKGIDFAGNRGDKVVAAADGIVVYAGDALRGYGKLIIIKHNDDYLSAYAHNDAILVKEKQAIKKGQTIAKMGDTDAKRVMLHFEVRFRGKSVNPLKYLPKR